MSRRHNERGAVLLLVLLVIALLAAILTDWAFSTLVDLRLTETFRDGNRAYYLARGGIEVGRQLLREDRNDYDAPGEMWEVGVPAYPLEDNATVTVEIRDEDGRINLNQIVDAIGESPNPLRRDRLRRLLIALDVTDPEPLLDALIDWIDRNDTVSPRGAESPWYQGQQPPGAAKNGPLDTVDELRLVAGFTPELVAKLTPYVTVSGGERLNLNTASAEVLAAWDPDVDTYAVQRLIERRSEKPFRSLAEVQEVLGLDLYSALNRNYDIAVRSDHYRILATAEVGDGVRRVEALVDKPGDRLRLRRIL